MRCCDPKIVFLSETKKKNKGMQRVKLRIEFENGFCVQNKGKRGGLAMLWRRGNDLEIKSYSRNLINAVVTEEGSGFKWRIMGFYGHSETHRQKESWNFLVTLNNQIPSPLVVLG